MHTIFIAYGIEILYAFAVCRSTKIDNRRIKLSYYETKMYNRNKTVTDGERRQLKLKLWKDKHFPNRNECNVMYRFYQISTSNS